MRVIAPSAKLSRLAALAAVILLSLTSYAQTPPTTAPVNSESAVNMLVLGDSISWGQGLKDEHKAWFLVKKWLELNSGRPVRVQVEAHSGAVIGELTAPGADPRTNYTVDGEISRADPTINDQIENALRSRADPSQVDLVLVNGCINDVDSRRLLNAANTPDNIR